jgi:hypothetical protein
MGNLVNCCHTPKENVANVNSEYILPEEAVIHEKLDEYGEAGTGGEITNENIKLSITSPKK